MNGKSTSLLIHGSVHGRIYSRMLFRKQIPTAIPKRLNNWWSAPEVLHVLIPADNRLPMQQLGYHLGSDSFCQMLEH